MRRTGIAGGGAAILILASALPAAAQDFCGGASAGGQWIGGTEAASDLTAAPAALEQMALVLGGSDYVALFSLSEAAEVRLEAQGRGTGDPVIDLRDEDGRILLSDDDSGGDRAARAETRLEPGRYCLSVSSYDGSPMTGVVRIGLTSHEALTAGMDAAPEPPSPGGAAPGDLCDLSTLSTFLSDGAPIDADLGAGVSATASVDEVPFWGFRLAAPAPLVITAQNAQADPVITLYDEGGSFLGENDDWDGLDSRLEMTAPLPAGTYCLAVNALSDRGQPITVTVSRFDAQAAQTALYDRAEASPPLDGSHPVEDLGALEARLRRDVQSTSTALWFAFDVPEAGLVLIETVTNGQGDPTLTLFDDFGRQIAFNDDNGETLDSRIVARVMPGTYLVALRQLETDSSALTRMLFERFEPAR
ncbi:ABC transporter substrate-binding protein [Rubellimicrobium sp. CFH 75288]|uniref:ABC transporter substrate-binding protein n=1 Tax=Rubellimicrobium sp. CFH 75288 TaxID=2697034 RepID=UPI001412FD94|nr:ABC transporter substrate-binding protein [Rubellimicrobium sp. CFH 75288]NAZ37230.1 ABC transporter substrate-binding protein [Rubellimicrobium sp. CFH 75288]